MSLARRLQRRRAILKEGTFPSITAAALDLEQWSAAARARWDVRTLAALLNADNPARVTVKVAPRAHWLAGLPHHVEPAVRAALRDESADDLCVLLFDESGAGAMSLQLLRASLAEAQREAALG